jgi:hypothetical protein
VNKRVIFCRARNNINNKKNRNNNINNNKIVVAGLRGGAPYFGRRKGNGGAGRGMQKKRDGGGGSGCWYLLSNHARNSVLCYHLCRLLHGECPYKRGPARIQRQHGDRASGQEALVRRGGGARQLQKRREL